MKSIKTFIKKIIGKGNIFRINFIKRICKTISREGKKGIFEKMKCVFKVKTYKDSKKKSKYYKLYENIELANIDENDTFYYSLDIYKTIQIENMQIENLSIDYKKILDNSLLDFKNQLEKNKKDEIFYKNEVEIIEAIEVLIDRITKKLESQNINSNIINHIKNIKDKKANTFYEALQRILFFNQLLWQTNHRLNGLGRLDMILSQYFEDDIKQGILTEAKARDLIQNFLKVLHKYYSFKSNNLMGDTGQIIELGGKDIDGKYQYNQLTYLFIEVLTTLNLPDPKILLRVSKEMPRSLMEKSLLCIQTGIGCPLFANDDVIIPNLIKFGYQKEDAYEYGTSACWEPFIIGKALDQNNIRSFVFIEPLQLLLDNEKIDEIQTKEQLIAIYKKYLKEYVKNLIEQSNNIKWEKNPLFSLLTEKCIEKNKDIAEGGAIYNHYGFTGVGLSNLVNSIVNIENLVFKNKEYTLEQLNEFRKNDFRDNQEIIKRLKTQEKKFGVDDEDVIKLTNEILKCVTEEINKYKNPLGGLYKFGLSAPSYITKGKDFIASFDGRKSKEPFGVHISSDSSNAYTELIEFASKLDYSENRFNGNVVDFFVSPNFIKDNFDKFVDFLMLSIKAGFFEMQMNVVSSKTLIEARKNPEKFPNLIVRVWGFSSYFKDLPDEYKDYLIERALKSEGNNY